MRKAASREAGSEAWKAGLPRLVLVADGFTQAARAAVVVAAVDGGVRWAHLRDHGAEAAGFDEAARRLARRLGEANAGVRLTVNTRWETARAIGAGLHVGVRGPTLREARQRLGQHAMLGFSAHTLEAARQAAADGADYLFYSPIFPTSSKPEAAGVGVEALRRVCQAVAPVPVFALGGITPERAAACREAGAYGVAVLSGIMDAADPAHAAREYLARIG